MLNTYWQQKYFKKIFKTINSIFYFLYFNKITNTTNNDNINNIFCVLMGSWASDVSHQRSGLDQSTSSTNAIVTSSNPPNEFTPNKVENSPRPNSVLSE